MVGTVIVLFALMFYAAEPKEWQQDFYLAAFGVLLIAIAFAVSWIMTPRIPPQKD